MTIRRLAAWRTRSPCLGTWLSIGSPVVAELAAESGFDWLLFDLEHGCGPEASLLANLQAMKGATAAAIVRVGALHPDLVMRALDWGADGIMVPRVTSAAEAEACVRAVCYPPRGQRGLSRTVRAYGYGLRPIDAPATLPQPLLFVQIESVPAIERAEEIAAVEGVDVLFVGPADLTFDLGLRHGTGSRSYDACLQTVVAAARKAGKRAGILLRGGDDITRYRELGFTHIAVDSDISILRTAYQKLRAGLVSSRETHPMVGVPPAEIIAAPP